MHGRAVPRWLGWCILWVAYALAFRALFFGATLYWFPPAGLRFALLVLVPLRAWPFVLLAELAAFAPALLTQEPLQLQWWEGLRATAGAMSGPLLLRAFKVPGAAVLWRIMPVVLAAMLLAALGSAALNMGFQVRFDGKGLATLELFLQLALGDFVGILLLAPPALALAEGLPSAPRVARWMKDAVLILLPALGIATAAQLFLHANVYFFATTLCTLPILVFAMRSGWRGVAFALPVVFIAVAIGDPGDAARAVPIQLFLAITGIAGLLLGASVDELNARNRVLESANQRLDRSSEELRDAARRNLAMSEDLRRWITAEVHDELGQNLTALQTRMKLVERGMDAGEQFAPLWRIVASMRQSVSGLMASLRPAGLDAFGLVSALQSGSIRELVETAGLGYHIDIDDQGALLGGLGDATQTTIYRIAQEAATNAVRHADATRFDVLLRVRRRSGCVRVCLSIADDGHGMRPGAPVQRPGIGLQGMRDRVLLLGGRMRWRTGPPGTRVTVVFSVPDQEQRATN